MNTVDKSTDKRPDKGGEIPKMTKKVGNTTYDVFIHFSETSKETMTDKVLRLIRNEVISKG
ncbi:MAG: transposon-encoded TnpW family protein [Syntrophomonadaceae bacterium]|jgi:hypothetical protein|nr:transposon-encoded TnpW family protein [Syntrophomonadaceae bacterium]